MDELKFVKIMSISYIFLFNILKFLNIIIIKKKNGFVIDDRFSFGLVLGYFGLG